MLNPAVSGIDLDFDIVCGMDGLPDVRMFEPPSFRCNGGDLLTFSIDRILAPDFGRRIQQPRVEKFTLAKLQTTRAGKISFGVNFIDDEPPRFEDKNNLCCFLNLPYIVSPLRTEEKTLITRSQDSSPTCANDLGHRGCSPYCVPVKQKCTSPFELPEQNCAHPTFVSSRLSPGHRSYSSIESSNLSPGLLSPSDPHPRNGQSPRESSCNVLYCELPTNVSSFSPVNMKTDIAVLQKSPDNIRVLSNASTRRHLSFHNVISRTPSPETPKTNQLLNKDIKPFKRSILGNVSPLPDNDKPYKRICPLDSDNIRSSPSPPEDKHFRTIGLTSPSSPEDKHFKRRYPNCLDSIRSSPSSSEDLKRKCSGDLAACLSTEDQHCKGTCPGDLDSNLSSTSSPEDKHFKGVCPGGLASPLSPEDKHSRRTCPDSLSNASSPSPKKSILQLKLRHSLGSEDSTITGETNGDDTSDSCTPDSGRCSSDTTFSIETTNSRTNETPAHSSEEPDLFRSGGSKEDSSFNRKLQTSDNCAISDKKKELDRQDAWPVWVYCSRYSARPSSGPRSRRQNKKDQSSDEKRCRTAFSGSQLSRLRQEFQDNPYLSEKRRLSLAQDLKLTEAQVKIWFQNRRAKLKKASGEKNPLAMKLMAQGLYNHSTHRT